jgi:hypothetical protein
MNLFSWCRNLSPEQPEKDDMFLQDLQLKLYHQLRHTAVDQPRQSQEKADSINYLARLSVL